MAHGRQATLRQIKQGVEVYKKAASLLKDDCPGQAAARAYYQVHVVAEHIARTLGPPFESTRDGQALGKLVHDDLARVVEAVFERQARRGQVVVSALTVDTAYQYAEDLYKARMEADYRPYNPFSKDRAQQLLLQAHTLTLMLIAEAEFLEQSRKQQNPVSTPGSQEGAAS